MGQQENLLNLDEPESYHCDVSGYRRGHPLMWISLVPFGDVVDRKFIYFIFPIYFEGPFAWNGANFFMGSDEECRRILDKSVWGVHHEMFKLFKVRQGEIEIKIVARDIRLYDSGPV